MVHLTFFQLIVDTVRFYENYAGLCVCHGTENIHFLIYRFFQLKYLFVIYRKVSDFKGNHNDCDK